MNVLSPIDESVLTERLSDLRSAKDAARVQGLANANEVCISQEVMEAPGVGEIANARLVSPDYVHVKGVGQKVEIHRIAIT